MQPPRRKTPHKDSPENVMGDARMSESGFKLASSASWCQKCRAHAAEKMTSLPVLMWSACRFDRV